MLLRRGLIMQVGCSWEALWPAGRPVCVDRSVDRLKGRPGNCSRFVGATRACYGCGSMLDPPASCSGQAPPDAGICQLDTNIHLWRITAHNAVHRRKVTEMLKAPPHHFRAGAVAPTAPHKPAELGDPGDRLAQRRRFSRWRGDPMDGTIQRLPFVGLQEDATRR